MCYLSDQIKAHLNADLTSSSAPSKNPLLPRQYQDHKPQVLVAEAYQFKSLAKRHNIYFSKCSKNLIISALQYNYHFTHYLKL